jgi:prevent-host-death family protein
MVKVSISSLKARLSDYVRLVRNGEEVLVTDRGVPVARIVPLDPSRWMKTRVMELVESGLAKPPAARLPKDFWKRPRPSDPGGQVLRALLEERSQGR